jgi:hypothetical protein
MTDPKHETRADHDLLTLATLAGECVAATEASVDNLPI